MPDVEPPADGPATYVPEPFVPAVPQGPGAGVGSGWPAPGPAAPWPSAPAYQYGEVRVTGRRLRTGWLVTGVVALAALGVLGYHFLGSTSDGTGNVAASAPASSPGILGAPPAATPTSLGATLESVAFQQSDFTNGWTVRLMNDGDRVRGQVTLDNCGYRFSTERHRVARRQYEVVASGGRDTGLSNEVVAYDSAGQAAEAMAQWRHSAAHCPTGPIRSAVAGSPRMRERTLRNDQDITQLPIGTNTLTVEAFTLPGDHRLYGIAILQVRDRFLDAVYVIQRRLPTSQDIGAVTVLAIPTGSRLLTSS